jgi:hypothetical protein
MKEETFDGNLRRRLNVFIFYLVNKRQEDKIKKYIYVLFLTTCIIIIIIYTTKHIDVQIKCMHELFKIIIFTLTVIFLVIF